MFVCEMAHDGKRTQQKVERKQQKRCHWRKSGEVGEGQRSDSNFSGWQKRQLFGNLSRFVWSLL